MPFRDPVNNNISFFQPQETTQVKFLINKTIQTSVTEPRLRELNKIIAQANHILGFADKDDQEKLGEEISQLKTNLALREKFYLIWRYKVDIFFINIVNNESSELDLKFKEFKKDIDYCYKRLNQLHKNMGYSPEQKHQFNQELYVYLDKKIANELSTINNPFNAEPSTGSTYRKKLAKKLELLSVEVQRKNLADTLSIALPNSFLVNLRRQIIWGLGLELSLTGIIMLPVIAVVLIGTKPAFEKYTNNLIDQYLVQDFLWHVDIPLLLVTIPYLITFGWIGLVVMSIVDAIQNYASNRDIEVSVSQEEECFLYNAAKELANVLDDARSEQFPGEIWNAPNNILPQAHAEVVSNVQRVNTI